MTVTELSATEYGAFYAPYLKLVPDDLELPDALRQSAELLTGYLGTVDERRTHYAYAPGKWTVAQSLQHIIDTDRIFSYRALCLARGEATPLPGFDQDQYADRAVVADRDLEGLVEEFTLLRDSVVLLFDTLRADQLALGGTVSGNPMTCRAMGFIMAGHTYHHDKIFRERYS